MNIRRNCMCLIASLMMIVSVTTAQAAVPAIYNLAPQNALVVVAMPSLSGLQAKISAMDKQLGTNNPMVQNLLPMLKAQAGVANGIDDAGGILFAVTGMPAGGQEPPMVVLVPVSDYKAFLGNFGIDDNGGVVEGDLQGSTTFFKSAGKYAVMSPVKDSVANYELPDGNNIAQLAGPSGVDCLTKSDFAIFINMSQLGPMAGPMIQLGLMQANMQMKESGLPPEQLNMMESMLKLYGGAFGALANDSQSIIIGVDLTDAGLGFSFNAQFKDGSNLGNSFAKAPASALKFDRLPNRPYLFLSSMDFSTLPLEAWGKAASQLMGEDNWSKLMKASFESMGLASVGQGAYYTPSGNGPTTSFLDGVSIVPSADPSKYIAATEKMFKSMDGLDLEGIMTVDYKKNVIQVDGAEVDQYSTKTNLPPEIAAQMGPFADMLTNQTGYLTKTDSAVVMTMGANPVTLKEALKTANGGGTLGNHASLANIRNQMGKNRVMEAYINIGELAKMIVGFAKMFNPDFNVQIPANLEPIGMSMSAGGKGMGTRLFIPASLAKAIMTTAQTVMQDLGGGGGGGAAPRANNNRPRPNTTNAPLSKNVTEINTAQYNEATATGTVVVEFYASWSSKSKRQGQVISKLADELSNVKFIRVDVDDNGLLARDKGVAIIPTIMIYKGGKVTGKMSGVIQEDKLRSAIN